MPTVEEEEDLLRAHVLYCTPHMQIPGQLRLRRSELIFEPDPAHPHVREFGVDQYAVLLEYADCLQCGAVVTPAAAAAGRQKGPQNAFNLQLHVRTLDGLRFCAAQDLESAWSVVFRMHGRDELQRATQLLTGLLLHKKPPGHSRTSVPFPSLDCLVELEAEEHGRQNHQLSLPEPSSPQSPQGPVQSRSLRSSPVRLVPGEGVERTLLNEKLADSLIDYLPIGLRFSEAVEWVLRYSPKAHGVSLSTFFRNLADCENTVIMLEDTQDSIFGGFCPVPWEPCPGRFYGSGEAFVFSFGKPKKELQVYPWTYKNSCFMYSDNDLLAMGGGDGRHAFVVRSDLLRGCSFPTLTFGNPQLSASNEFVVRDLEVWALVEAE